MIAYVGETLEQREAGTTVEVVAAQTKAIAGKDAASCFERFIRNLSFCKSS